MFGKDATEDQQPQNNDQSNFTPPGMAPTVDHALALPAPGSTTVDPTNDDASEPSSAPAAAAPGVDHDELLSIKQEALQHLSPLVGHLEQSPEEKFRTTMMMIQASDDQSLIKVAYEAAQQIADEKARAQALLDVINEINYFTQQQQSKS